MEKFCCCKICACFEKVFGKEEKKRISHKTLWNIDKLSTSCSNSLPCSSLHLITHTSFRGPHSNSTLSVFSPLRKNLVFFSFASSKLLMRRDPLKVSLISIFHYLNICDSWLNGFRYKWCHWLSFLPASRDVSCGQ